MQRTFLAILLTCLMLWAVSNWLPGAQRTSPPDSVPRTAEGKRIYTTQRLVASPPEIDGELDDPCWEEGEWSGNYTQYMPEEGKPPTQETEIKILYDDRNVYVAFRMYDSEPDKIDRQMGRRDAFEGDIIGVCFDSYFDHRTGFEFDLTAAGSKIDLLLFNTHWDTTWDAVWEGKVAMTSFGWTAEMQIPLNQLRYGKKETQVWGLHSWRWINRNREEDQWNMIGRDGPGHLYSIGELHGIEGIPRNRHVELLPYVVGQLTHRDEGVPSQGEIGTDPGGSAGLDGKVGLSSAFTLDFTVNPDFGQVEADPSVINLTAYETFYEEKRPFFLEGKNIFEFGLEEDQLSYSRRIGQAPHRVAEPAEGETVTSSPSSTSILGALKLTGKTRDGLTVGVIESLTAREKVTLGSPWDSREETVEPLSNFLVTRIQKDFDEGNTFFGGMMTSVHRRIEDPEIQFLPEDAFTGGLDFRHHWGDKAYFLDARFLISKVKGTEESILGLQQSSARYYQRPDAIHLSLDPTRTSLSGHGGRIQVGKGSRGRWRFSETFNWRSPGLELNDAGYLPLTDLVWQKTSVQYVVTEPSGFFREYTLAGAQQNNWDFGGEFLEPVLSGAFEGTFSNKWGATASVDRGGSSLDTRLLRGGPAVRLKGLWGLSYGFHTDHARRLSVGFRHEAYLFDDGESRLDMFHPSVRFRVTDPFLLTARVDYSLNKDIFQYVSREYLGEEPRDLVARIDQETLGLTFRVDYAVTPELTIQYYGSPFVSSGAYDAFKRFTNPRSEDYSELYHTFSGEEIQYDPQENRYHFDENRDGTFDYSVSNPDFNFREFHSNLVARWEYKPGSVLYVVWTQGRSAFQNVTGAPLGHSLGDLFSTPAENVFLVKLTYWLPM